MTTVLEELVSLLSLEQLEENLFRGQSQDLGWGTVFGGQVLGQALSAASKTVPDDRPVHSLHAYFLRPGDVSKPIIYEVDRIRDGASFTTRRVVAIQHGKAIFNMAASFQTIEEGFDHQDEMPSDVPAPESVLSEQQLMLQIKDIIPPSMRDMALAKRPIELHPIDPQHPLKLEAREPHRMVWYRASEALPDDPALHRYLLAYASDFHFLTTSTEPHGVTWFTPGMQMASLDHSMWFHRPVRMDDWLLHVIDSPSASGARGLVRGRFFTRDGVLVASTAQEGLVRMRPRK